jgi:hypothetical protein
MNNGSSGVDFVKLKTVGHGINIIVRRRVGFFDSGI